VNETSDFTVNLVVEGRKSVTGLVCQEVQLVNEYIQGLKKVLKVCFLDEMGVLQSLPLKESRIIN
jgi:hypothetical protein